MTVKKLFGFSILVILFSIPGAIVVTQCGWIAAIKIYAIWAAVVGTVLLAVHLISNE